MNFLDKVFFKLIEFLPLKKVFVKFHASTRNLKLVKSHLNTTDKVLDVGCGLGLTGEYLTKKGFQVTGIELDSAVVNKTKKYASYEVHNGNAAELHYKDSSFDAVIFMYVMHHIPIEKHKNVLSEAKRVLKSTGKIILIEPVVDSKFDFAWDKLFFNDCFFHYFDVTGKFSLVKKGGMRIYEIKQKDISSLEFSYRADVE